MGRHQFSYAIMPHAGNWREAGVVAEAHRFNAPLLIALGSHPARSFASVDDPNLVLDTIKKAEDDDAIVLRLYECHGARGTAWVHVGLPFATAVLCDILGDKRCRCHPRRRDRNPLFALQDHQLEITPMNSGSVERNLMLARDQMKSGRLPELEQTCRAILSQHPEHPQAMQLLGVALAGQGRFDDAIEILAEAVRQRPAAPQAHHNLAKTLADCGRGDEAIDAYRRAIQLRPAYVQAHTNLAIALHGQGRLDEAIAEYRLAVSLQENSPEAHYNLANALKDAGLVDEAIAEYRQALQLRPRYAQAHANLGSALFLKGEIDEAKAHAEAAIDIDPAFAEAHNLLGNLAKETGQLDEALAHYRRAFSARPEPWALGNYLYMLHFHPDFDALRIREEHRRYNERFAAAGKPDSPPCQRPLGAADFGELDSTVFDPEAQTRRELVEVSRAAAAGRLRLAALPAASGGAVSSSPPRKPRPRRLRDFLLQWRLAP